MRTSLQKRSTVRDPAISYLSNKKEKEKKKSLTKLNPSSRKNKKTMLPSLVLFNSNSTRLLVNFFFFFFLQHIQNQNLIVLSCSFSLQPKKGYSYNNSFNQQTNKRLKILKILIFYQPLPTIKTEGEKTIFIPTNMNFAKQNKEKKNTSMLI